MLKAVTYDTLRAGVRHTGRRRLAPSLWSIRDREDPLMFQLIADIFSTGVLDTLFSVIDVISWEE